MVQIKKAFVLLSRDIHPDKFGGQISSAQINQVVEAMKMVATAGDMLKNVDLKKIYDNATSADDFLQKVQQFQSQATAARQQAADAQAREEAEASARAAAAAAQEAQRAADEAAQAAVDGSPPREEWYRATSAEQRRAQGHRETYQEMRRPQKDAAAAAASRRDRAEERQSTARAQSIYEARSRARDTREADAYLAQLARRSLEAQQADIDLMDIDENDAFIMGGAPISFGSGGRVRGVGVKHGSTFGRPSDFGKNEYRESRAVRGAAQAEGRAKAVREARNKP